jgi:hypothetical protein
MNNRLLGLGLRLFRLLAGYTANGSTAFAAEPGSFRKRRSTIEAKRQPRAHKIRVPSLKRYPRPMPGGCCLYMKMPL